MSQLWIMSDWHWGHQNMYLFTDASGRRVRERFKDAAEGDAYIEQRIRDLIRPSDHVYDLGDFTLFRGKHRQHEFVKMRRSLPGHWRAILGNHDHYDIKTYIEAGFEKIKASNVIDGVLLTHYPIHPDSVSQRLIGNAHGHTHSAPDESPRHLNVSLERTGYEPVPIEWVKEQFRIKQLAAAHPTVPQFDVLGNEITGL